MTPAERLAATQLDLFWLPPDARVLRRPGLLAIGCDRPLPHLNIGLRADLDGAALSEGIEDAMAWFAPGAGRWFVPDTIDRPPLEAALREARFSPTHRFEARLRRSGDAPTAPDGILVRRVDDLAGIRAFVRVLGEAFGNPVAFTDDELREQLRGAEGPDARTSRWLAHLDGEPVAAGGLNLFPAHGLGLLWAGCTVPAARGRGAYKALLAARLDEAARRGLPLVGLYAREDTSAPIVARLGFEEHGEMTYWAVEGARVPA